MNCPERYQKFIGVARKYVTHSYGNRREGDSYLGAVILGPEKWTLQVGILVRFFAACDRIAPPFAFAVASGNLPDPISGEL